MTNKLGEVALDWVTTNMSWDAYDANWDESGAVTFKAGAKWLLEQARKVKFGLRGEQVGEDLYRMTPYETELRGQTEFVHLKDLEKLVSEE